MSDHHRHTLRVSRSARTDSRHTVRVTREQVGGAQIKIVRAAPIGPKGELTGLYSIPEVRKAKWIEALNAQPPLQKYAGSITTENWGTLPDNDKLDIYIELIERQDELFLTAVSIIYNILDIDPDSENLEQIVFKKIETTSTEYQDELKEYLADVHRLITCTQPDTEVGADTTALYNKQTRLLKMEPLSNTLLRPQRVTNMLISSIVKILISLKKDSTLLDAASKKPVNPNLQAMFSDVYNTYIQQEALEATSKSLRDGFYPWQEVRAGIFPPDECSDTIVKCAHTSKDPRGKPIINKTFWENFCNSSALEIRYNVTILFSGFVVDIFNMYRMSSNNDINTLRKRYIDKYKSDTFSIGKSSIYRPTIVEKATTLEAKMMRMLDPKQYTFIFHLLYTLMKMDPSPAAATTASA